MSTLILDQETQLVTVEDSSPTISVLWDRAAQQAVINTAVGPTVASRAYGMVHTAMYDAWASYDALAVPTQLGNDLQRPEAEITETNKQEAMSYAAYRVLIDLFPAQIDIFDELMAELGLDTANTTTDTTQAAGIGNLAARTLLEFRYQDNSNQLGNNPGGTIGIPYSDITNYEPVNSPENITDLERWTPEYVPVNDPTGSVQQFLTPHWGEVTPFAIESGNAFRPEAPKPFLLVPGEVNLAAKTITLADGSIVDINPSLIGTVINPEFIEQAESLIETSANLTDEQKLIAEFWEDGGGTSFPPGTWMSFAQFVSARDDRSLDDDAKLFFSLGNAVFDAGIATWEAKTFYDYTRPVRAIQELGELGLIGEFNEELDGYAIEAWQPNKGTQTILAEDFLTYQTPDLDVSPPFAEYTSGHSAFSAAGAAILQRFTGSDDFGGLVTFASGESRFEPDLIPEETVTLEWETFSEAADEAGISRIYGGIHFEDGDLNGRTLGTEIGNNVFEEAQRYINGNIDTEYKLEQNIYRLRGNNQEGYLFAGEAEKAQIDSNFAEDFTTEGIAFKVGVEANDSLIAMYRFQNQENPGCYLIVGEEERANINNDSNYSAAFKEEGLAFFVYSGSSDGASDIYRFRSTEISGNYIYVAEAEKDYILSNYGDTFVNEGVAFAAEI